MPFLGIMDGQHWSLYHPDMPDFIRRIAAAPPMLRLQDVGMNCGCEYTRFPLFASLGSYSRFQHSVGAGLIVWHFTGDVCQSVAALLHDIATPVFAHVVDFLHGDHLHQEYTEHSTLDLIAGSPELVAELRTLGLNPADVSDYHRFPIADNDTPRLSSDRLEYTLGNILNFGFADSRLVCDLYEDLCVGQNEEGAPEIMFCHCELARSFAQLALRCSKVYVSDEDRYAMQMLAELLRDAIAAGLLAEEDLMRTEPEVIARLEDNPLYRTRWQYFRSYCRVKTGETHPEARVVPAKKRHINPYVRGVGRVTSFDATFKRDLEMYLQHDFQYPVRGVTQEDL